MSANDDIESTLTDRYQTTVPETVRRALRLAFCQVSEPRRCKGARASSLPV